ncbi:MAG: hypothetical protein MJB14_04770 [Spirochaetes bacterium]|nr:hypothetical protein [Spirochaetota bacterium]
MKKNLTVILFIIIRLSSLLAIEKYVDVDLIKESSPPRIIEKGILITLPKDFGHTLTLRSNLDGWMNDYFFKKSFYDIYYLVLPYSQDKKRVAYLINVDGYWEADPSNPNYYLDKFGKKISYVDIKENIENIQIFPIIREQTPEIKKVTFKYYAPTADNVTLVCSVDNMSVFSHQLIKKRDNYWTIDLFFSPGEYYYYFYVDGEKMLDFRNDCKNYHPQYGQVSCFTLN